MKSFRRICLIVTVLVVLFLLIGLPYNATNESSNITRTITLYPSISTDPSAPDQGYVSALQASTAYYYAEGDQLNIGTQSGAWGLTGVDDDFYQSIDSQFTVTQPAIGKSITTGTNGPNDWQQTQDYDGTFDETSSILNSTEYIVSDEIVNEGTTNGISGAQTFNDGSVEKLNDSGTPSSQTSKPDDWGPENDKSYESIAKLWYEDGIYIEYKKLQTLHTNSCDISGISGTLSSVVLYVNYTVEAGYNGDSFVEYKNGTETFYSFTTIQPSGSDAGSWHERSSSLANIDTADELQTLNLRFYHNGLQPKDVLFEQIRLEVTFEASGNSMDIIHEIPDVPDAGFATLCIYGNRSTGEYVYIDVWDSIDAEWDNLDSFTTTPTWINNTIDPTHHIIDGYVTVRYRDTSSSTQVDLTIDAVLVKASGYTLDLYYEFQWTGDEVDVLNISVWDVSSSTQDMNVYIYDSTDTEWDTLNFNMDSSMLNHSQTVSSSITGYLNGTGDTTHYIRIRYLEVNSDQSAQLRVDYLGVKLHFSSDIGGGEWETNIVYDIEDFAGDRSTVTQITVHDSSFVDSGSAEVQIYDYDNNQWISCFSIGTGVGDSPHSRTLSSSPSRFISSNPGNVQIRYILSDATGSTLSVDFLRVDITYGGNGGVGDGGDGTSDGGGGGGGDGGTTIVRTLSAQISYNEETEKYVPAEIDVTLADDEGTLVSNASVTLTFVNEIEPYELEEKEGQYKLLLETDTLDTGNYTFTISAKKSGFRDFLSSAFPFNIVVKYPFATAVQYPDYWPEYRSQVVENPISVLIDPSLYILPALVAILITLQVTTFAAIDPRKLRSIYIFTNEGQGLHYRTFFEEKGGVDSQLMSAALSGIVSLVMEATRSEKPLRTIDIETFEIFLEYGQYITIATFVGKRIFYKRKIRRGQIKLIDNIERRYSHVLSNWTGDLSHFYEMNQLVFDAFDFKLTKDLSKLVAGAAQVQLDLVSLYSMQEKYHMSGRALWKAYDLYTKIEDPRAGFILQQWKALEKAYFTDHFGSPNVLRTKLLSKFFVILDFIRTAGLLKILFRLRSILYPEISKELYYFIPPDQLTERTDEGI